MPSEPGASASEMGAPAIETPSAPPNLSADALQRFNAVRAQIEFWFSASNLRRDWYLRRQMDDEGWLDPSVFLLFNRIKNLNATLADIIAACRSSDELEVSEPNAASFGDEDGQTRVRRSPELPDFRDDDDHEVARSFILKGIPADSTINSLQAIFEPIAQVAYVRIYRNRNFPATPRALICFEDPGVANQVFERFRTDPPQDAKGIILRRRRSTLEDGPRETSAVPGMEARPSLLVCHISGLSPDLDWRVVHKEMESMFLQATGQPIRYLMYQGGAPECHVTAIDSVAARALLLSLSENGLELGGTKTSVRLLTEPDELKEYWRLAAEHHAVRQARRAEKETSQGGDSTEKSSRRHPQGVIVKISGLPEEASWRDIKADISPHGNVVYLNYERNSSVCYARLMTAEEAMKVKDILSLPDELVCDASVEASILEGDEEAQYWIRAEELVKERANRKMGLEPNTE